MTDEQLADAYERGVIDSINSTATVGCLGEEHERKLGLRRVEAAVRAEVAGAPASVFVFERGWDYEGSDVQSIRTTHAGAVAAAEAYMQREGDDWSEIDAGARWGRGARYVRVYEQAVINDTIESEARGGR